MGADTQNKRSGASALRAAARKRLPVILVLAAGAVVVAILLLMRGGPRRPEVQEEALTPVQVERIDPVPELADRCELYGDVKANRVVDVAAEVAARIEGCPVQEGQKVRQGERLITLNTDVLQAQFDQAQAQFQFDRKEHDRYVTLRRSGAATANEVDVSRTKLQVSRAALALAKAQLERTGICAPISGTLNRLPMEIGEYVKPGDVVAQIVDIDVAKVVVQVSERDVGFLRAGDEAKIVLVRDGQRTDLLGKITYISELAAEQTHTTAVEISVDNRQRALRSGAGVNVSLTRRVLKDVIMIPLDVATPVPVAGDGRTAYIVYVLDKGVASQRDVELELNLIQGKRVRVSSGLSAGEQLIVVGQRYVSDGQKVLVRPGGQVSPQQ